MAEGFDLSDIPLVCDNQSDLDSTSESPMKASNYDIHFSLLDRTSLFEDHNLEWVGSANNNTNETRDNLIKRKEDNGDKNVNTTKAYQKQLSEDNSTENENKLCKKRVRTEEECETNITEGEINEEWSKNRKFLAGEQQQEKNVRKKMKIEGNQEKETKSKNRYNVDNNEDDDDKDDNDDNDDNNANDCDDYNNEPKELSPGKQEESRITKRIRTEEEIKLREFDVLDEIGPFDDKSEADNQETDKSYDRNEGFDDENDGDNEYNSDFDDLSEEEIDAMLEERLNIHNNSKRKTSGNVSSGDNENKTEKDKEYVEKEKTVLVEKVKNHFEVLPDGWVSLTHNSGMPLYLHKNSRVCTLSKPYSLGTGSARRHTIPLSAIPCLEYRKAKEDEVKKKSESGNVPQPLMVNGTEIPCARIETAQENESSRQLTPEQLNEYCRNLFEFETIRVLRFKSWLARRQFKKKNNFKDHQRPTLPSGTKLITCPIKQSNSGGHSRLTREWIMNPNGKSYVCILHEYVQRALKDQPVYTFKELENTATPYLAVVSIGKMQYGTGFGSSKKQAKHDAAKTTLEILIPEMKEKIDQDEKLRGHVGNKRINTDLSFFDSIKIEDPRVTELCAKTTEPLPHEILLTCLQRNFGLSQMNIKYETTALRHSKNEFTMTVGNHTAKVVCKNKKDGKQKASQAILQALHPHIPSWGSLLRLYGNSSMKSIKEKKIEEQEITLLQNRGNSNSPNYAILNKLKEEMRKFKASRNSLKPIGKFIPPDDVELPAESGADLSNVFI